MKWLRESGLETAIKKLVSENIPAFGICGGYQIMGKKLRIPTVQKMAEVLQVWDYWI